MNWTNPQITKSSEYLDHENIFTMGRNADKEDNISLENAHSIEMSGDNELAGDFVYNDYDENKQCDFMLFRQETTKTDLKDILENKVLFDRNKNANQKSLSVLDNVVQKNEKKINVKNLNRRSSDESGWNRKFSDDLILSKQLKRRKRKTRPPVKDICFEFDKTEFQDCSLLDSESRLSNLNHSVPSITEKVNKFQNNCAKYINSVEMTKTSNKKFKFKKIFDPKKFFSSNGSVTKFENFQEKFNMFLFLPQLLLFNNMLNSNLSKANPKQTPNPPKPLNKNPKQSSETITHISMNSSQRFSSKSNKLTDHQKHKKISKKLRRAWNLNQQIPINIFKKQVRYKSLANLSPNSNEEACNLKDEKDQFFGMKRSARMSRQRKSKLDAKNKIKNSMLRRRKQRAPLGEEKEHLEYKRLVGLKRDLDDFLGNESNSSIEHLFGSNLNSKKCTKQRVSSHFDQIISPPLQNAKNHRFGRDGMNFEYVEFLDFSFKNINKPNFLVTNITSK